MHVGGRQAHSNYFNNAVDASEADGITKEGLRYVMDFFFNTLDKQICLKNPVPFVRLKMSERFISFTI